MTQIAEPIRLDERKLVQLATKGDTGAFEELCRRHAPAVWRFAHAVTASPAQPQPPIDAVREATVDGMARALLALERTAPAAVAPYRSEALTTILRHAPAEAPSSDDNDVVGDGPAAVAAFVALPLQWRAVLWLADVEGLSQRTASTVLGLDADAVDKLADRARSGYGGKVSVKSLRSMVQPLPTDLVDLAWQRWQALRAVPRGPFGLVVSGHRTPAWVERAVAGAAATVIALGITGAVVFGGSPDGAGRLRPAGIATEQLISAGFEEVAMGASSGVSSLAPALQSLSSLNLGTTPNLSRLDLPPLGALDLTPSAPVAKLRQSDIGAVSSSAAVALDPSAGGSSGRGAETGSGAPAAQPGPTTTEPGPAPTWPTTPPTTEPPTSEPPTTEPPTTEPPTVDPTVPPTTEVPILGDLGDIGGTGGDGGTPRVDVEVGDDIDVTIGLDCTDVDISVLTGAELDLLDEECGETGQEITTDGELLPTLEIN